jgi:hypothetical protein
VIGEYDCVIGFNASTSSEHTLEACAAAWLLARCFGSILRGKISVSRKDTRFWRRNRLSFAAGFVVSEFPAPAWRNWQTRWTQNSEIADFI